MSDIFVKAVVLQGVLGSVQCGQQILGHERHLVLKGLLKLSAVGRSLPHPVCQHEAAWSQTWQTMAASTVPSLAMPGQYLLLNGYKTSTWQGQAWDNQRFLLYDAGPVSGHDGRCRLSFSNTSLNKDLYLFRQQYIPGWHTYSMFAFITQSTIFHSFP